MFEHPSLHGIQLVLNYVGQIGTRTVMQEDDVIIENSYYSFFLILVALDGL
jgi:hypothetical protein